jgi:hypothetical protein
MSGSDEDNTINSTNTYEENEYYDDSDISDTSSEYSLVHSSVYEPDYYDNRHAYRRIVSDERQFLDSTKKNNQYIIGFCSGINDFNELTAYNEYALSPTLYPYPVPVLNYLPLFCVGISCVGFMRNTYRNCYMYLYNYSGALLIRPKIEIIKLYITDDDAYIAIIKTFWLKIVQRTWKRRFQERIRMLQKRRTIQSQTYFQQHGKYPSGIRILPTIHNMIR